MGVCRDASSARYIRIVEVRSSNLLCSTMTFQAIGRFFFTLLSHNTKKAGILPAFLVFFKVLAKCTQSPFLAFRGMNKFDGNITKKWIFLCIVEFFEKLEGEACVGTPR